MPTGTIAKRWDVATNGGFAGGISFVMDGVNDPLGAYSAQLVLLLTGAPTPQAPIIYNSTDPSPLVSISGNIVSWDIASAITDLWTPGVYTIQVRVFGNGKDFDRWNMIGPGRVTVTQAPADA